MAGNAERRESLILANGRTLVALLARDCRMTAEQRKSVLVIFELLRGHFPTERRVTTGAVGAHLPLVHIRVAVLTILTSVGKHRVHMARDALHFFVQAPEGILSLVVVELWNLADGPPGRRSVAIFAGNVQRCAVRTPGGLSLRRARRSSGGTRNVSKREAKAA